VTPEEVLAIVQIFATIEPIAVQGINSAITMFQSSNAPAADKMKMLTDMQAALKPMNLIP
jgi:hypothetical protein